MELHRRKPTLRLYVQVFVENYKIARAYQTRVGSLKVAWLFTKAFVELR